jgi:hypothetical protein
MQRRRKKRREKIFNYNLFFCGTSVVDGNDLRYSTARAISGGIGGGVGR